MQKGLRLFLIIFLILCCFSLRESSGRNKDEISFQNGRALSLRVLQETLANHPLGKPRSLELTQLGYITRFRGYVVDTATHDIILVGDSIPFDPPLNLDDFVVALRNAWEIYTETRGNLRIYSDPGCSIDPDSQVLQRLQKLENLISSASTDEEVEKRIQDWCDHCKKPQQVRVMGVPFKSRFAKVMVQADYDMKTLVNGSDDTLNVAGFKSLTDMTLDAIKPFLIKRKPIPFHISTLNRFWFYPGKVSYLHDEQTGVLDQCQVKLLTEEEFLEESGTTRGTGQGDSLALLFCEDFTNNFSQIAEQRPIYAELEELFRFVALAKLMRQQNCTEVAGLDLSYLLYEYKIATYRVSQSLPGRSNVKEFTHRREYDGGYGELHFWLQNCGGVKIEINPKPPELIPPPTPELKRQLLELRENIFELREHFQNGGPSHRIPSRPKTWLEDKDLFFSGVYRFILKPGLNQ